MRFVEEIVVDEFLPTYRSLLADALRERGLTQSEVADLLGISQSAVSKYVHGDVERNERFLNDDDLRDLVDRVAEGLASGEMRPVQALVESEVLIREMERGGPLAQLHEEAVPALAELEGEYAVHDPDSDLREAEQVLASVRRGLRVLENTSGFATLIPAVGSNLAEALSDAGGVEDVAAVPGRIVDVKGRATIPAEPEFGVSEHVANVLLAARAAGSDARATLNVAYDEDLLAELDAAGYETVEFEGQADLADAPDGDGPDDLDAAVAAALADAPDADVLYHTGGFGVEPIVYLLGPDAPTVAGMVRDVA
ncbi:thiamine-phosphate synthase family protein [Halomicrobium urmianum]|uniref:thiamine-phosphate synthase family protein n=1 Tax=Halomicrobium urmianum TaxID=1586233 RepID=UPI001CD964FD|nr:thiamine-phosphate synthase family protein [Halomicrobium urmianum]